MSLDPAIATAPVASTATVVWSADVRRLGLCTVQVQNLEAAQTFVGFIQRKVTAGLDWSTSMLPDFTSIQPAGTLDADGNPLDCVTADIDVEGTAELRLVGHMTGAGGDVQVSVRTAGPKR